MYRRCWAAWASASGLSFVAGVALAVHHPLWPAALLFLFCLVCVVVACRPGIWLVAVPAALPALNFSPWTGWLIFEEFDLLLLAVFVGAYARLAWQAHALRLFQSAPAPEQPVPDQLLAGLLVALVGSGALALVIGFHDAGGFRFGWFAGYTDSLNTLRVFKSLFFGALTLPLLAGELRISRHQAGQRLALGMALGLACVVLAVLWERVAFPGLTDFSTVYRTTALFWEMHVGGGAIDAYLAMAAPFSVWGLARTRPTWVRIAFATLAALTVYACLMTYSRGVYLAAALLLALLLGKALLRAWRSRSTRAGLAGKAVWSLVGVVAVLVIAVTRADSFMVNRLAQTERVFGGRLAHWQDTLGLLRSPTDWLLGVGLGRFPARYDREIALGKFAGTVQAHGADGGPLADRDFVRITGPSAGSNTGGLFALTQRVSLQPGVRFSVGMQVRVSSPTRLAVQVCERHLLYQWNCQRSLLRIAALPAEWQHLALQLGGPAFAPSRWYAPRLGMLSVSVINQNGKADISRLSLNAPGGPELIANGDFSRNLARWFPAAQYFYLPWHTDSLYLEVLIERGLVGLAILAAVMLVALRRLLQQPGSEFQISAYLALSLVGALLVGTVSSLMDVPRVAFLFYFLTFFAIQSTVRGESRLPSTQRPPIEG